MEATITATDGTVTILHDQAYTDAAVAAVTGTPPVAEVDVVLTDGTTKKFVAA